MIALVLPVIFVIVDFAFIMAVSAGFTHALVFVDLPSLIAVPLLAWLSAAAGFGFKRSLDAWRAPARSDSTPAELRSALAWTGSLAGWIAAYAGFAAASGIVLTLTNISVPEKVGPNLAVALLSLLYAALAELFLVLPARTVAARRLAELS